ncbi:unannotated protein [freshwater metagenome]|uniref:Unannotated protein n=1 Tax=freshwater metagenome TaxID=449393 RepID=A0A6J6AZF0_9ZZZZ
MIRQDLLHKPAVLIRHHGEQVLLQFDGIHLAHPLVLAGDDNVDSVRLIGVLINPSQFGLELFHRVTHSAQYSKAASVAHCCNNIAAMSEGEDWEFDTESIT